MAKKDSNALQQAGKIIERFGGIRPMAAKIDVPVTTVQGWKKRDVIPAARRSLIIQAAEQNNIDLSDLGSNTNTINDTAVTAPQSSPKQNTADTPSPAHDTTNTTQPTATTQDKQPTTAPTHDAILAAMEETRQKTLVQSVWIATGLILLAGTAAVFLLWPSMQKTEDQTEKLIQLEDQVDEVKEDTSFLKNMVPENIKNKVETLQDQARTIQDNVQNLTTQANTLKNDLIGESGTLSERLNRLEQQIGDVSGNSSLAALIERIQTLENSAVGQGQLQASMSQLQNMMTNASTTSNPEHNLTQDLANAQANDDGALGETLEGINSTDLKAAAMLIAFSQLRNSLHREESFEDDLMVLQKLAGQDNIELQSALSRLAPHADNGVLSTAGLSQEFKGLAGDIVFASIKGEDVSFQDKFKARLNNVIQVEKNGELVTGTPTQSTVMQAQKMLDDGNIEGAITQLQTLQGPAAQTAQPFIQQAQISLLAKQAEQMIGSSLFSKITSQLPLQQMLNGQVVPEETNVFEPTFTPTIRRAPINIDEVKKTLEGTVPLGQPADVIVDEKSGVRILPNQSGFKGFSGGGSAPTTAQ